RRPPFRFLPLHDRHPRGDPNSPADSLTWPPAGCKFARPSDSSRGRLTVRHFSSALRAWTIAAEVLACAVLAGCAGKGVHAGLPGSRSSTLPRSQSAPRQGEVLGTGETCAALRLPLSAGGNGGAVATELKNACLLAMEDVGMEALE